MPGGLLVQDRDWDVEDRDTMEVVAGSLTEQQWGDLLFAWRVCKHVSSNAIVIAKDLQTIGIGAGQKSRVDAVRIALEKAQSSATTSAGSVLASDAFFPFADGPELALDAGVTAIIQPGGSKRDDEVVAAVEAAGAAMVLHRPPALSALSDPTERRGIASRWSRFRAQREHRREGTAMAELDPLRWKALAVVCAAFFMTDPRRLDRQRRAPVDRQRRSTSRASNLQWVITAYAITFGGFLLLGGRAADLLGRRRIFLVGVIALHGRLVPLRPRLVRGRADRARAVQGLGAAIISPAALSIIMTTFEEGAERNKALGIWGAIGGSGAAVGVLAGGVLTKYLGWEWIFFVNVPVGVARLRCSRRGSSARAARTARARRDVAGAVTVTAGLALLRLRRSRRRPTTAGDRAGRSRGSPRRSCCSASSS